MPSRLPMPRDEPTSTHPHPTRRVAWLVVLTMLLGGCLGDRPGEEPGGEPVAPTTLVPVVRFVDRTPEHTHDRGRLESGIYAGPNGQTRRVLSALPCRVVDTLVLDEVPESRVVEHTVPLPTADDAPWVVIRASLRDGWHLRPLMRPISRHTGTDTVTLRLAFPLGQQGRPATVEIERCPVYDPRRYDATFPDVPIPADAVLRAHVTTTATTWDASVVPVVFRVMAARPNGDVVHVLRRRLDPGVSPEDRRWIAVEGDLAELAGETVRLTFSMRPLTRSTVMPPAPLWGTPTVLVRRRQPKRPNVILVSLDTLRSRSVGTYGSRRATSPSIDAIAEQGTLFEHAVAPFSYTLPSHVSMFTGLYQRRHGVRGLLSRLAAGHETLAETLEAAGYATVAITDGGYLEGTTRVRRGFEYYVERPHTGPGEAAAHTGAAGTTFRLAASWLWEHDTARPFFLFLHTYHVHSPYTEGGPYAGRFANADHGAPGGVHAEERARYEECVRSADDAVRDLFDELRMAELLEDTLVVLTSDHGEEFGEHGGSRHGPHLYDEVARVPLIFHLPGRVAAGRRVADPVSLVDLRATILDLVGLPADKDGDGTSLAPAMADAPHPLPERVVYVEGVTRFRGTDGGDVDVVAAVRGSGKCIRTAESVECFDLAADPRERASLPPDALPDLRAALQRFASKAPAAAGGAASGISPILIERMRALGYLDDE